MSCLIKNSDPKCLPQLLAPTHSTVPYWFVKPQLATMPTSLIVYLNVLIYLTFPR